MGRVASSRTAKRRSRAEWVAAVERLRAQGFTQREVAARLGLSRSYVSLLLTDPDGSKDRARKDSYGGVCESCGARTDGSNGRAKAPTVCAACAAADATLGAYWTPERLLAAAREWERRYGYPPRVKDWQRAQVLDGYRYPCTAQCYYNSTGANALCPWPSWSAFLAAAGFPGLTSGRGKRRAREVALGAEHMTAATTCLRCGQREVVAHGGGFKCRACGTAESSCPAWLDGRNLENAAASSRKDTTLGGKRT